MFGSKVLGLLRASHFGPTLLVVSMTFVLALTQFSTLDSFEIALAIFLGQLFVGWTNDLIDFSRDQAASRQNKPLVAGTISKTTLKVCIFIALVSAIISSLIGPLGIYGSAFHILGLISATAYNLKLKATIFSVIPYMVSFGALPCAIYFAAGSRPPIWLVLAFVLVTSAFHFLNVLKDLDADIQQEVLGLPQVLGRDKSIVVVIILVALAFLDVAIATI